jgi:hypothetical protein
MYCEEFRPHASLKRYIRSYIFISFTFGDFHFPADGCPGLVINALSDRVPSLIAEWLSIKLRY